MYGKVHIGKHLSDNYPIQSGLKQGDVLSSLLFSFAVEYVIRQVEENQMGLKLNGTLKLLFYAGDMNLLGDNVNTRKKATETLIDFSKEVGLEVNTEKTKYMLLSHHRNAGQTHDMKMVNRYFENVAQFKYL
jgi:hypothetical protein